MLHSIQLALLVTRYNAMISQKKHLLTVPLTTQTYISY